jgi:hypothetical protein
MSELAIHQDQVSRYGGISGVRDMGLLALGISQVGSSDKSPECRECVAFFPYPEFIRP